MTFWLGVDGGGSTLRVVIVDDAMQVVAGARRGSVNPSSVGRDLARRHVLSALDEVFQQVDAQAIAGAGIGIAGAPASREEPWLRSLLNAKLPESVIVPSSDFEIALVGARAERSGLLLLAGTGSVAYGCNENNLCEQIGGWGYRLGDEGSGYWIGMQALKALTLDADGMLTTTSQLPDLLREALGFSSKDDILRWMYDPGPQPSMIASYAVHVLHLADEADLLAVEIVMEAADHLTNLAERLRQRLGLATEQIAFAGGLLSADNALTVRLIANLGLRERPIARYAPATGAALLSKLCLDAQD